MSWHAGAAFYPLNVLLDEKCSFVRLITRCCFGSGYKSRKQRPSNEKVGIHHMS